MKAHDVAQSLQTLSRILKEGENVDINSLITLPRQPKGKTDTLGENAPAALALLVRLAGYSKNEWRDLIAELEFDVPIKATDSVRDILGRLLKYLGDNRDVQEKLIESAKKPQANVSPELMKALSILMNK